MVKIFFILSFLVAFSISSDGQMQNGAYPKMEPSSNVANTYLKQAYDAYNKGNLRQCKSYLERSEKRYGVNCDFYALLGQYFYVQNLRKYSKRYWTRGLIKFGCEECANRLGFNKPVVPASPTYALTQVETNPETIEAPKVSDVDIDIPVVNKIHDNRYALVIGNEDYHKFQEELSTEQNVAYAHNDAQVFRKYLINTLGFPQKQVFLLLDATRGQMGRELERLVELAKLAPDSELLFYFAGHGLPDIETHEGYIMPVDVSASYMKEAFPLSDLYAKLSSSNAARIAVFLDACFSGGGRGENGLLAARTVKVKPRGDLIAGNLVVFTAASGEEVSQPLKNESHGLFTYLLLRKLKDTGGNVTLDELRAYLDKEVPKLSLIENSLKQTPQVLVAPEISDKWPAWDWR